MEPISDKSPTNLLFVTHELFALLRDEFRLDWNGIHGRAHWLRVRANGLKLAPLTGAKPEIVELFAVLHDSQRQNDRRDPDHGPRAAEFVAARLPRYVQLSSADRELLSYACAYHTSGFTEADITVQTCWDADRLDLGRIHIRPEPRLLCTCAAKQPDIIEWAIRQSRQ